MAVLLSGSGEENDKDNEEKSSLGSPAAAKSLAATLGSIEKTEPEVSSPPTTHRTHNEKRSSQPPPASTSSDASPDDSPVEILPRWEMNILYNKHF